MNPKPLTSQLFDECLVALRRRQPHEAMASLARLSPASLDAPAAALHAELGRRAAVLLESQGRQLAETRHEAFKLLDVDHGPPLPGISIVGACMNRQANLLRVLPSWLASPVDEILIVDWSSTDPLWPMVQHLRDPRLRVVRVDDEPRWILSHAFNLGLRLARHERLYKLDADIQLEPHFFEANHFGPGEFVRGFWKSAIDSGAHDQIFVNGSFGAMKTDLREVGYYDERILTYGWDDSDLYMRLSSGQGLAGRLLVLGSLRHLEQEDGERIAHQDIQPVRRYGNFAPTEHENQVNRFQTATLPEWSSRQWTQDYEIVPLEASHWVARRRTVRPSHAPGQRVLAETIAARVIMSWLEPVLPPETWPHPDSLELARLMRQADRRGLCTRLGEQIRQKRGVHLLRVADPIWRDAVRQTLQSLRAHHPELPRSLVILEDDGFRPEAADEDDLAHGLHASGALLDAIGAVVGAQPRAHLRQLADTVCDAQAPCTRWRIDDESVAQDALELGREVEARLGTSYRLPAAPVIGSVLVTSLFDDRNLIRVTEYLACLALNSRVFETIIVVYEHGSGLMLKALSRLREALALTSTRWLVAPAASRPSLADLVAQQSMLRDDRLLAVANADVVFDATLEPLNGLLAHDHVAVLSRRELPAGAGAAPLIRSAAGTPNIFSADAWIVRTPFSAGHELDYPIGTFYCDSFVNGRLGRRPGVRVSNPCLDTHLFHVHDARFNSSDTKKLAQREYLEGLYAAESRRWGDPDPVKGVPWCTTHQLPLTPEGSHVVAWKPRSLSVDLAGGPPSLAGLLCVWLLGRQAQWMQPRWHLIVRLRPQDAAGPFGQLLARVKLAEGLWPLLVDIAEAPGSPPPAPDPAHVEHRVREASEWLQALYTDGLDGFVACLARALADGAASELRVDLLPPQDTSSTLMMLQALERHSVPHWTDLRALLGSLPEWLAERRLVLPFLPDIDGTQVLRPVAAAVIGTTPRVAFVTSMFRGGVHTAGYLENVAAAADRVDGEVIIVDANGHGADADAAVVDDFLARHPAAARRFLVLRPDRDPGLYNCWRMAIEHARAPLVSNANLDDRRSPDHSLRLAELLEARGDLAAACGALTVVGSDEQGGWFDLLPNETWFGEPGLREFGYDELFRRAEDGTVFSQNMLHCMPVWRRSLHERHGWFDEERYGTSADWAFWLALGRAGERFALDPQAWGRYFFNPSSHNRRNDADGAKERHIIAELIGVWQDRVIKQ